MRLKFLVWGLAGLFWVAPRPVSAEPIVIFFSRTAIAGAQVGGIFAEDVERNADVLVATASASQGASAASAESTFASQLGADNQQLSGSGLVTAQATAPTTGSAVGFSSGQAFLQFSIDQPYTFSFFGSFAAGVDGSSLFEAALLNRTTPGFHPVFDYREESARVRNATGLLLPGQYDFLVLGRAAAGCGPGVGSPGCDLEQALTSFSFDFQLASDTQAPVVPEPGTVILLSSGLAGLVAARRRRTSANSAGAR